MFTVRGFNTCLKRFILLVYKRARKKIRDTKKECTIKKNGKLLCDKEKKEKKWQSNGSLNGTNMKCQSAIT